MNTVGQVEVFSQLLDPMSGTLPEEITTSQSLWTFCQHLNPGSSEDRTWPSSSKPADAYENLKQMWSLEKIRHN